MQKTIINSDDYTLLDFLKSDEPDPFAKAQPFYGYIEDLRRKGRYSYHRVVTTACTNKTTVLDPDRGGERRVLVMNSNNYLGLNTRPEVIQAAHEALMHYGSGLCGSRFLSGTYDLVVELEKRLAVFEETEAAVVFTTGYQANVATISALMRPGDIIFIDRLSHASVVDGCRVAGCAYRTYRHNDPDSLRRLMGRYAGRYRGKLVVAEGIFSMDGDMAPLPEIVEIAEEFGARIMVDEAHATGVVGPHGQGTVDFYDLHGRVDIVLGTFSKSLAATGGFVATSKEVANYIRHYGRAYMFTASPVPSTIAAVTAALEIMQREPALRERLWENIRYFSSRLKEAGFDIYPDPPQSAIITVKIGADAIVHAMSKRLFEEGVLMSTVVYPAVSPDEGRLRLSLSARHSRADLDRAVDVLSAAARSFEVAGMAGAART